MGDLFSETFYGLYRSGEGRADGSLLLVIASIKCDVHFVYPLKVKVGVDLYLLVLLLMNNYIAYFRYYKSYDSYLFIFF